VRVQRRLVIPLPDVACVSCGVRGEMTLGYTTSGNQSDPPGTVYAEMRPPPLWVRLCPDNGPHDRLRRTFLICGACYEKGAANGTAAITAHVEVSA